MGCGHNKQLPQASLLGAHWEAAQNCVGEPRSAELHQMQHIGSNCFCQAFHVSVWMCALANGECWGLSCTDRNTGDIVDPVQMLIVTSDSFRVKSELFIWNMMSNAFMGFDSS